VVTRLSRPGGLLCRGRSQAWRAPLPGSTIKSRACPARMPTAPLSAARLPKSPHRLRTFLQQHITNAPSSFCSLSCPIASASIASRRAEYIKPARQPMDGSWAPKSPDLSSYYSPEEVPLHPQHQGYRGSVSHIAPFLTPTSSPPQPDTYAPPPTHTPFMPRGVRKEESMQDVDYLPDESAAMGMQMGMTMPSDAGNGNGNGGGSTLPANVNDIVIKNHFPVARIKRIMQADDDVGKVAQVTPVVVCACLQPPIHPALLTRHSQSPRTLHDLARHQGRRRGQGA
jgi:hypothetical protein